MFLIVRTEIAEITAVVGSAVTVSTVTLAGMDSVFVNRTAPIVTVGTMVVAGSVESVVLPGRSVERVDVVAYLIAPTESAVTMDAMEVAANARPVRRNARMESVPVCPFVTAKSVDRTAVEQIVVPVRQEIDVMPEGVA